MCIQKTGRKPLGHNFRMTRVTVLGTVDLLVLSGVLTQADYAVWASLVLDKAVRPNPARRSCVGYC